MILTRFRLLLCAVLLLPLSVQAEEQGRTYVIQKGDTLWGISQKFLKDPYYWPNLWANNPDIRNPHFIYPGQTVRIYDGRIEIVPAEPAPAAPPVTPEPVAAAAVEPAPEPVAAVEVVPPPAPEPDKTVTIKVPGGAGFVTSEELESMGRLVDAIDNRILLGSKDTVFLKLNQQPRVGERFDLFEVGTEKILHPVTGKPVGFRVVDLGSVDVTAVNPKSATGVIRQAYREVPRGARLQPHQEPVRKIALKKAQSKVTGYVIDAYSSKTLQGQHDIIFLDRGVADGLAVGNLVYVSRPRRLSPEAVAQAKRQGPEGVKEMAGVVLPDELLGMAVLVEVKNATATALMIKAVMPVERGDRVLAATE